MKLKRTTVAYSIENGGDGSAYPSWFLTEEDAETDQELALEGWGKTWWRAQALALGTVETFEGSDIHIEAKRNSKELIQRVAERDAEQEGSDDDGWQ
jgi:hypothetical protein